MTEARAVDHSPTPSHVDTLASWVEQHQPVTEPTMLVDNLAANNFIQEIMNNFAGHKLQIACFTKTGPKELFTSLDPSIPLITSAKEYPNFPRAKKHLYLGLANPEDEAYNFIQPLSVAQVGNLAETQGLPSQIIFDGNYLDHYGKPIFKKRFSEYLNRVYRQLDSPETEYVIRIKSETSKNLRHGHASGLTATEILNLRTKLNPQLKLGVNLYLGNPLTATNINRTAMTLASLKTITHLISFGGLGGFMDDLPLESIKKILSRYPEKKFNLELGTALVERSCALVFPKKWSQNQITDYIPDADSSLRNRQVISLPLTNGLLVLRPVAYTYTQKLAQGKKLAVIQTKPQG